MLQQDRFRSLSKLSVPVLTITDFEDLAVPMENRQCYILTARIHPGESNSSWVMHVLH